MKAKFIPQNNRVVLMIVPEDQQEDLALRLFKITNKHCDPPIYTNIYVVTGVEELHDV